MEEQDIKFSEAPNSSNASLTTCKGGHGNDTVVTLKPGRPNALAKHGWQIQWPHRRYGSRNQQRWEVYTLSRESVS